MSARDENPDQRNDEQQQIEHRDTGSGDEWDGNIGHGKSFQNSLPLTV